MKLIMKNIDCEHVVNAAGSYDQKLVNGWIKKNSIY